MEEHIAQAQDGARCEPTILKEKVQKAYSVAQASVDDAVKVPDQESHFASILPLVRKRLESTQLFLAEPTAQTSIAAIIARFEGKKALLEQQGTVIIPDVLSLPCMEKNASACEWSRGQCPN